MKTKEFFFDTETTGLDDKIHEITQLSGYILGEPFNFKCRPTNESTVDPIALKIQHKTLEEVMAYPPAQETFDSLIILLDNAVSKYKPEDRMDAFAFNANFDMGFLIEFFKKYSPKTGNPKFPNKHNPGSYIYKPAVCVMYSYRLAVRLGVLPIPPKDVESGSRYKLFRLCQIHGIEMKAHDAMEDITATMKLQRIIEEKINGIGIPSEES